MVYNLIKLYGENSLQSSYADTVGITTFNEANQQGFITYLPDAITATVTEEINGQFDLVMSYPVTGDGYSALEINRIIACKPNPHSSIQAFRIYKISKPLDGIVEVTANHISYDLNGYILNPFTVTNKSPDEVIKAFKTNSVTTCPFTFSSDVNKTVSKFAVSKPISIREMLGGNLSNELSLIQTCSGEFEFDNLSVALKEHRGSDNGVRISYGKNLTEFKYDEDSTSFYTGVYPYWSTSKKPENSSSNNVVTPTVTSNQLFEATAQYGNMNLVLSITKGSTSGGNTTLNWSAYFKIVVQGGYHFNYQNFLEVYINGVKKFSSANVKAIDINGLAVGATVQLASGTATVPSSKVNVPVSATFIQRQDTRGTWKISGNYSMTGGTEVVTNVDTDDIYYTVTMNGTKVHNYDVDSQYKKLYTLDLSKYIEQAKNSKGEYIYPGVTPSQVSAALQQYLAETDAPTVFSDSLEVSFVDLAQSDEYKDYAGLETVNIGDIVTVDFPLYGVSKSKECVKTEYDVLSDSYINLTLGEITDTLASTIQNGVSLAQRNTVDSRQLENAVNANFNSIQALNITASTIQADYVVVNERLTATEASIGSLTADYGSFKTLTAGSFTAVNASITNLSTVYATISSLSATNATISNLSTVYATISSLSATNATISNLSTVYATISSLSATNAAISNLSTVYATISDLSATNATISNLSTVYATISDLSATNASITNLSTVYATISDLSATNATISNLSAVYATISELSATNATISNLSAVYATISSMEAGFASINSLFANYASLEYLSAHYAEIDFANISIANVSSLFAIAGIISDLTIASGHLTGELQFVTLSGDLIEVGTLVADRIVMLGTDGLYYQLNTTGETVGASQTEYNSLHGDVITAQSITADKIYVTDLYAFGATIGTLTIDQSSIHTVTKDSVTSGNTGIFISPTAFAIGNATNKLTYNADGNNTLQVTGEIIATSGNIGNWLIDSNTISKIVNKAGSDLSHGYRLTLNAPNVSSFSDTPAIIAGEGELSGQYYDIWTYSDEAFKLLYDGTLYATKAHISGEITASSGEIAGWEITSSQIKKYTTYSVGTWSGTKYTAYLNCIDDRFADGTHPDYPDGRDPGTIDAFAVTAGSAYKFRVRYDGTLHAAKAYLGGTNNANNDAWLVETGKMHYGTLGAETSLYMDAFGSMTATINGSSRTDLMMTIGNLFGVQKTGKLFAGGVVASGMIVASSGQIGGWTIGSTVLYGTNGDSSPTEGYVQYTATQQAGATITSGMYAYAVRKRTYTNGAWGAWDYQFQVKYSGQLIAKNVDITGKVTATSGEFTGAVHASSGEFTGSITATSGSFVTRSSDTNISIANGTITMRNGTTSGGTIGYYAGNSGFKLDTISNGKLFIASPAINNQSVYIANNTTNHVYSMRIAKQLSNPGTGSSLFVRIDSATYEMFATTSTSSKRFKKDISVIEESEHYFDGLLTIQPKHYTYTILDETDQNYERSLPGLIAEDVNDLFPIACIKNKAGEIENWDDRMVLVGTLALLQKLYKRVDELERKLATYDK